MAHPTLAIGTRVRCTYRNDPGFQRVGTLIADDDPRGWTGTLAFPDVHNPPTLEQVREHIANVERHWPGGAKAYQEYNATRAVVAWDFGKVYGERASAVFAAAEPRHLTSNQEHRMLLRFVMGIDPNVVPHLRTMLRLGVRDLRPDTMLVRNAMGLYDRTPDPGAWNATARGGIHCCLVRHRDGEWAIHS